MIIVLLGSPGSGKGTQAKRLCGRYNLTHLSTGDIFRQEMQSQSALGRKAEYYVKSGGLVPDELVTEMVAGRMDVDKGRFLLDGFPRNLQQAESLDADMRRQGRSLDLVICLNLSRTAALKRLTARRTCVTCGEVYNEVTRPCAKPGACDRCGGEVKAREDDSEATANKRLMLYEDVTHPLIAYYRAEGIFREVDAAGSLDTVTSGLCVLIDGHKAGIGGACASDIPGGAGE